MNYQNNLLSQTINILRFPLTVCVIFIHFNLKSSPLLIKGKEIVSIDSDFLEYIIFLFSEIIPSIAVPLFFFISGFLFFYGKEFNLNLYKSKLRKRVHSLFIPYIIWNLIALCLQIIKQILGASSITKLNISYQSIINTFWNANHLGIFPTLDINDSTWILPQDQPLWYIRDLMIVILVAPIIHWLLKRIRIFIIILFLLIWFITEKNMGHYEQLSYAFTFFSIGAFCAIHKIDFVRFFRHFRIIPFLYAIYVLTVFLIREYPFYHYIYKAGIVLGVISAITIVSKFAKHYKNLPHQMLTDSTFFIYALHMLIIGGVAKLVLIGISNIIEINQLLICFFYFIIPIAIIIICFYLYKFLHTYFPNICRLLTGGR